MSGMYRDRAWCSRSRPKSAEGCCRESCDRYVTDPIWRDALAKRMQIVWADLKTSKCGYLPREVER